jgi:hypothetical protein
VFVRFLVTRAVLPAVRVLGRLALLHPLLSLLTGVVSLRTSSSPNSGSRKWDWHCSAAEVMSRLRNPVAP